MSLRSIDDTLEGEIVGYLAEHPDAMDSVVGIAEWWLERRRIRVAVDALSRALSRLVDRGVVETVGGPLNPLYRLREQFKQHQ